MHKKIASCDLADLGLDQFIQEVLSETKRFALTATQVRLEELDQDLLCHPEKRPGWTVQKQERRTLVTSLGDLYYNRRYYKNAASGKRAYLVDKAVGIEAYERISKEEKVSVCDHVVNHSYQASVFTSKTLCAGSRRERV